VRGINEGIDIISYSNFEAILLRSYTFGVTNQELYISLRVGRAKAMITFVVSTAVTICMVSRQTLRLEIQLTRLPRAHHGRFSDDQRCNMDI
jgi:hypothetical protein